MFEVENLINCFNKIYQNNVGNFLAITDNLTLNFQLLMFAVKLYIWLISTLCEIYIYISQFHKVKLDTKSEI